MVAAGGLRQPEAPRAHVGPDAFDVRETFVLGTRVADRSPATRDRSVGGPDGVLLLVIDHNLEMRFAFEQEFTPVPCDFAEPYIREAMKSAGIAPPIEDVGAPLAGIQLLLVETRDRPWLTGARLAFLDQHERHRAEGFRSEALTQRYVATWFAARTVLARHLVMAPDQVPIHRLCAVCGRHGHGRPVIASPRTGRELHLSISRTDQRALLAIASRPVGVDLEEGSRARTAIDAVWGAALTPQERGAVAAISDSSERHRALLLAWVRKEAVVKASGDGFVVAPDSIAVLNGTRPEINGRRYSIADVRVREGVAAIACLDPAS